MARRDAQSSAQGLPRRPLPMDRCWSVPFTSALSAFLLVMNSSCYGFLYVLFMKKYGISHAEAAWPSSALVIAGSSVCIVVSQLQNKLSVYHITLLGGFLASLGLVASAFAPNIAWMTFTFGVLHGAGIGTALLGYSLYILLYFDKYKSTAFAIMWVFRGVSGMAGTHILWHLTSTYGVQGSLLITGGVLLNVLPFTMFIKSPSATPTRFCGFTNVRKESPKDAIGSSPLSNSIELPSAHPQDVPKVLSPACRSFSATSSFASAVKSMRTWPFYVAVSYSTICDYIFVTFSATVVAYGVDKGVSLVDSKQLLIYNSVGLVIGRVVIPFTTDKMGSRRCPAAVGSFLVAAICFAVLTRASTYASLGTVASLMGVAQGYLLCVKSVIISDHVGLESLTFCLGVAGLLSIPLWLSGPSIIGFFRDKNASYDQLYVMLAALCLVHAILLGLLAWREMIHSRRRRKEQFYEMDTSAL